MRSTYSPSEIFSRLEPENLAAMNLMPIYVGEKARTLCVDAHQEDCRYFAPKWEYDLPRHAKYAHVRSRIICERCIPAEHRSVR
jgi:hypothetical protein